MSARLWRSVLVAVVLAAGVWYLATSSERPPRVGDVPYVPSRALVVDRMLEMAGTGPEDVVYDLGSGDGRIVIRAAERFGAAAVGYELDADLVEESRSNAANAGVYERVEFVHGDLFEADLGRATVVTLYLLPTVNLQLRPKLLAELGPGTPVVSQSFDMAEWQPDGADVVPLDPPAELYLWFIPAPMGGVWEGTVGEEPVTLRLVQSFQQVEGELLVSGEAVPVVGRVEGERVRLEASRGPAGLPGRWLIGGTVAEDVVEGTVRVEGGPREGERSLSARRTPASAAGTWDVGAAEGPFVSQWTMRIEGDGRDWRAWRRFPRAGERVVGNERLPGASVPPATDPERERPMRDFYVWGGSVYFVVGDAGGRVAYRGLLDGDTMLGTVLDEAGSIRQWVGRRRATPRAPGVEPS